jgi:hypothetical protein
LILRDTKSLPASMASAAWTGRCRNPARGRVLFAALGVNPRPVLAATRWIPGDDGSVVRAAVSLESGGTLDSRFLPF